ncbi:MAG: PIN domain-containing protein [Nitrospirae bacterium]|nr:MAG: PIN domain-containing protein [Nitrospirota bacterium]
MKTKVLFDTSVLVAALVKPHPAHQRAFAWLKKAKSGPISMVVSSHTLAELYAVLTTLPVSPRITPEAASRLIQQDVFDMAVIAPLSAGDYKAVIKKLKDADLPGGIIYDALICQAAVKSQAELLLTLNGSDFRRLPMFEGIKIVEP